MKVKDETMVQFYQKLGQVYYRIAFADGNVSEKEIKTLKDLVSESWLELEDSEDEFGSDAAIQIEAVFDAMLDNRNTGTGAIEHLKEFKDLHAHLFTKELKDHIQDTALRIAKAFHGLSKDEREDLKELKSALRG